MGDDDRLDEILEDWCERRDRGESVDPEKIVQAHPELAERLRARFAAVAAIDEVLSEPPLADRTPTRLGEYEIQREIGSGGMGTVYLASDANGDPVALKILHPHLLARPGFFKRFLREAEAGRKVRHENVVRTLDADALEVEGRAAHFLVMEYVQGQTLRELLNDLHAVPEALLREIALQAAVGLRAIHDQGIVHRDLKPENVIITHDQSLRIMDLGVARLLDESVVLTQDGQFAGSLPYAAPEQFTGDELGPAADLYSLGVLLFELATGANFFRRDQAAQVMAAHLDEEPPDATESVPELSLFFSELLSTLLAKSPADRIESAQELFRILSEGERSDWWSARESECRLATARRPAVPVRRETPLHGRESDLANLNSAWSRARQSDGNTLLLEGEAGIGKSRLVDAFLEDLDGPNAVILYGSYPPSGGLGGLSDAVLSHFGACDLEESLRPHLTVTPRLVPVLASLLRHEAPPDGGDPLRGDALHTVFVNLMRSLAANEPVLWIVEDLHFADPDSRQIVLSLARAVEGHSILLLLTTRPGLPEDELAQFSRLENFRRTGLGRLSAREVVLLLQDAFRSEALADKLGARIALKSDGVPFFVFEMIRGLREGQFITELPDGSYVETEVIAEIPVPSAVRDLIEARLQGLAEEERAILDVGAVQGFEFEPDLVADVLGARPINVLRKLGVLERRSGVVRGAGANYRFDHHQIQEVIYGDLHEGLKAAYHTELAKRAARVGAADREGELPGEACQFIAHHGLRGRSPHLTLPWLMPGLKHLSATQGGAATVELANRALAFEGLLEGLPRARVLLEMSHSLGLMGRHAEQRSALVEAACLAEAGQEVDLQLRACLQMGDSFREQAQYPQAREEFERAGRLARANHSSWGEREAGAGLGKVLSATGRFEEALAAFRGCLDSARADSDRPGEVHAIGDLGSALFYLGRNEEAEAQSRLQLELAREDGDKKTESLAASNHGYLLLRMGRYEDACDLLKMSIDLAREIGFRRLEGTCTGMLNVAYQRLGMLGEARVCIEKAKSISREVGDLLGEARSELEIGVLSAEEGLHDDACSATTRGLTLFRQIGDRYGEARATGNLGVLRFRQGLIGQGLSQLQRYLEIAREIGDREGEVEAALNLGEILSRLGDLSEAEVLLERSCAAAREVGGSRLRGLALLSLGRHARVKGDDERALRYFEESRDLLEDSPNEAYLPLIALGEVECARGEAESAAAYIDRALPLAEQAGDQGATLKAKSVLAELGADDLATLQSNCAELEDRADHEQRMEARLSLWRATSDLAHLEEAHRLLCHLRDHAPDEYRETMIANVPLHRDIMAAWAEHGEP